MPAWKGDYRWLWRAFEAVGGANAEALSEAWRWRIEDDLETTLDYHDERADGTATVWCGKSSYTFSRQPTSRELLDGLDDAYVRELKRLERHRPTRNRSS